MIIEIGFEAYKPKTFRPQIKGTTYFSQKDRERVCGSGTPGIFQIWWFGTKWQFNWFFRLHKRKGKANG